MLMWRRGDQKVKKHAAENHKSRIRLSFWVEGHLILTVPR